MSEINLLPFDLTPKKSILRLANILTKVIYAGIAIFLVFVLTILGIFFVDYTKIKNLKVKEDSLKESVKEYQQIEQQMVLAKDRISKIKEVWKTQSVIENLNTFEKLLPYISSGIILKEAEFSLDKSEITVEGSSSLSVSTFLGSLVSSNLYKTIKLTNFSFNPNYGYRISFQGILNQL